MPQGMQVFNKDGKLINDTNDRFPRIKGRIITQPGVNGEQTISIPDNTEFIFFTRNQSNLASCEIPAIQATRTKITWTYGNYDPNLQHIPYASALIMWGYY